MRRLRSFLSELIASGDASAAVALVGTPAEIEWHEAFGEARPGVVASTATRFDYASLTKPFLATLALALEASGELRLGTTMGEVWGRRAQPKLAGRTLEELLRHRAGMAAWLPLYHLCRTAADVPELLLGREEAVGARPGTYSDLGYVLFRMTAERLLGRPLEGLLRERVLAPLRITSVEVAPGGAADVAASQLDTAEEVRLSLTQNLFSVPNLGPPAIGVPNDGNGRFLGGLAGHVGLFGTARDLWRLGTEWLRPGAVLTPGAVARALSGGGPFALGWWRRVRGSAGPALPASAFGHTGFAGGSLWLDPEAGRVLVLLASRTGAAVPMNRLRRRFHALAYHDRGR